METIVTTINIVLLIGLILSPIIILRHINRSDNKFKFLTYLPIGLIMIGLFSLIFAWWSYTSTILLLKHYNGYVFNPDSNGYQVSYEKVLSENIDKVKSLEMEIMGIGWPLKAYFMFVYIYPILFIVYLFNYLIDKIRKIKHISK
jgi:hypothetical protein